MLLIFILFFFFFNDTATTEIYTLSLHDALPISISTLRTAKLPSENSSRRVLTTTSLLPSTDRKSTRLNSSHVRISYAVFCLKKKIPDIRDNYIGINTDDNSWEFMSDLQLMTE